MARGAQGLERGVPLERQCQLEALPGADVLAQGWVEPLPREFRVQWLCEGLASAVQLVLCEGGEALQTRHAPIARQIQLEALIR